MSINIALLNKDNYMSWSRQIRLLLEISECPLSEVLITDGITSAAAHRKKCNKALGLCMQYISQEIINEVIESDDMNFIDVWTKLGQLYGPTNSDTIERFKAKVVSIKLEKEDFLHEHVAILKEMFKLSVAYGLYTSESEKIEVFLKSCCSVRSLKDIYKYVGSVRTFEEVVAATINYVKYKAIFADADTDHRSTKALRKCFNCNQPGHIAKFCKNKKSSSSDVKAPGVHGVMENDEVSCFRSKSIYANLSRKHKNRINGDHIIENVLFNKKLILNSSVLSSKLANGIWYLDSGAAVSVTWDKLAFTEYRPIENSRYIQVANGDRIKVAGIGKVMLKVQIDGVQSDLVLTNVLHVPSASFQLISLSSLANSGCKIDLDNSMGTVQTNSGKVILKATLDEHEKLWKLSAETSLSTSKVLVVAKNRTTVISKSLHEWHVCLGHRNHEDIVKMEKNSEVDGMKITDYTWNGCSACELAKGGKSPISKQSELKLTSPGFIVGDLMDFGVRCHGNYRYVSSFIDAKTRYCSVKLLKSKAATGVLEHFQEVVDFIATQTPGSRHGTHIAPRLSALCPCTRPRVSVLGLHGRHNPFQSLAGIW